MNPVKRGINVDPICNLCKMNIETTLSLRIEVRKIWFTSPLSLRIEEDENKTTYFQNWFKNG